MGPDGSLWFTEQMVNKLGRLDPKTGEFKEYPLVERKNSGPHGLVADRDGNIWFTANFGGYIGKLDPRVLLAQVPRILRADVYATAALTGAVIMLAARKLRLSPTLAAIPGGTVCFLCA